MASSWEISQGLKLGIKVLRSPPLPCVPASSSHYLLVFLHYYALLYTMELPLLTIVCFISDLSFQLSLFFGSGESPLQCFHSTFAVLQSKHSNLKIKNALNSHLCWAKCWFNQWNKHTTLRQTNTKSQKTNTLHCRKQKYIKNYIYIYIDFPEHK